MSEDSYLKLFRTYLQSRTDAPSDFHTHAGLATLAVALGNRCWCDGPAREVFPNLQSVVLAPSGMGKSVPLDMATIVLRKAQLGGLLLPASFSQEALLEILSKRPLGYFVVQEFASFMALCAREYNHGLESTLTELYDVPEVYSRFLLKNGGTWLNLARPCVTILGASSPDWFAQAFKASALRGGFLARFLFCPSRKAGEPIGDPGPRDDGLEAELANHLMEITQGVVGRFELGPASASYTAYARDARRGARDSVDFGGMRSRAPIFALKVAMCFHVSRSLDRKLTKGDMDQAIHFVQHTLEVAEDYLGNEVAHNREDADRLRITEIVRACGGRCQWSYALKNSHMDALAFERAVRTLEASQQIVVEGLEQKRNRWLATSPLAYAGRNGQVVPLQRVPA